VSGSVVADTTAAQPGSASLAAPDYWWYRARSELLETVLGDALGTPARVLDVGSADGPSVSWMRGGHRHVSLDLFPDGLTAGEGVCGSATALPFRDGAFDVVAAYDVVEHCRDDRAAVAELVRALAPGGRLLLSVPAYSWAWSDHDVRAGHHRRYTERQLVELVEGAGLTVTRSTHAFGAVFPLFVAERLVRRAREALGRPSQARLTPVPGRLDEVLMGLCGLEGRRLGRRDVPVGSAVFLAALKP